MRLATIETMLRAVFISTHSGVQLCISDVALESQTTRLMKML
jgi:hypothetical protein